MQVPLQMASERARHRDAEQAFQGQAVRWHARAGSSRYWAFLRITLVYHNDSILHDGSLARSLELPGIKVSPPPLQARQAEVDNLNAYQSSPPENACLQARSGLSPIGCTGLLMIRLASWG